MKINKKKNRDQRRKRAQPAMVSLDDTEDALTKKTQTGKKAPGFVTADGKEGITYAHKGGQLKHQSRSKYSPGGKDGGS